MKIGGRGGLRQVFMALMNWATHVLQWSLQKEAEFVSFSKSLKKAQVRIVG